MFHTILCWHNFFLHQRHKHDDLHDVMLVHYSFFLQKSANVKQEAQLSLG